MKFLDHLQTQGVQPLRPVQSEATDSHLDFLKLQRFKLQPLPPSIQNFADQADRFESGKIGDVPPQNRTALGDSLVIAFQRFEVQLPQANIKRGRVPPARDSFVHPGFDQPKGLQMLMDQFQVLGAVIIKIEPGPLLVWIHYGYLEHFPSSNGIILFTAENAESAEIFFQIKKAQTKKIDAWI
jgi:hypothetical protein